MSQGSMLLKGIFLVWLTLAVGAAQVVDKKKETVTVTDEKQGSSFTKDKGRYLISEIPELPASVARPGTFDKGTWLILFHTPWCQYSQNALPHFLATVQSLVDHNITGVTVGKLDISKQTGLSNQFNIRSTPVISLYHKGSKFIYQGDVTSQDLIAFVVKIIKSNLTVIDSQEKLEAEKAKHPVLFIAVYDTEIDSDWHTTYTRIAHLLAFRAEFFYTTDPNILETPPAKLPALLVLKEGTTYRYEGTVSRYHMSKWILSERFVSLPIANLTTLNQFVVSSDLRKILMLAIEEDSARRRIPQKKALEVVKKLANSREYHKKFQLVLTEGVTVPERLLRQSVKSFPLLFSFDSRTSLYNIFRPGDKGYTESEITNFIDRVQASEIAPEGGHTFFDRARHIYYLIVHLFQAMLVHHPYLGAAVVLSMMGVVVFYTVLCCRGSTPVTKLPRNARAKRGSVKKPALAPRNNGTIRQRTGENNTTQEQTNESSESEIEDNKDK